MGKLVNKLCAGPQREHGPFLFRFLTLVFVTTTSDLSEVNSHLSVGALVPVASDFSDSAGADLEASSDYVLLDSNFSGGSALTHKITPSR